MNKLFTKIAALCLGATMAVGVGVTVASSSKTVDSVSADSNTVTFTAGTDVGTASSVSKDGITISSSSGNSDYSRSDNYRVYSGKTVTIASTVGNMTSIVFTASSTSYNKLSNPTAGSISWSSKTGTWTGDTDSVTMTSSGGQSRLTKIVVTYTTGSTTEATGMTISPSSASVYAGETVTFTPTLSGGSGDYEKTISWSSSNTSVVASPSNSEDGSAVTVTALTVGSTTITGTVVSPGSATGSITITVNAAKTLGSISVATAPTKTTYSDGEMFDPTGLVINRIYTDSTSDTYTYAGHTSDFTFSPSTTTALTTSDTSVTITYGGKSATQSITVNEVTKYELITDASGLVAGCDYLIGNAAQTYFMSTTQNSNNRGRHQLAGSVSSNKVSYETGMEVVTLGGSSGAWTLYANNSDTAGYLYLPSNNNYLRTRASSFDWDISFSSSTPSISATVTSTRYIKHNSGSSIFSCYTSGQENISLWKEVSTTQSIAISKGSVSGLKGDSDDTVSITASNFTPTDIEVAYSTSGVATVTKGTISDGIIPLNVSYTGVGETTATITVKGGTADYSADLAISVAAKPQTGTMVAKINSVVVSSAVEVQTGQYKQFTFAAEDTEGNAYSISADDVTGEKQSGSANVTISGTRVTGDTVGSAVVRYSLKVLSSVYVDITLNVIDDYLETVNSVTYVASGAALTPEQGDSPSTAIFATRTANTHFGSTDTIPLEDFTFSYDNNSSSAVAAESFSYDFTHGTTVDPTHKSQTIYVFVTLNEVTYSCGSYTVTVSQKTDPLTAVTITNVTNNEKTMTRGESFQLTVELTPENPTDVSKDLTYRVDSKGSEGIDIEVSSTGLISVGALSDLGDALIVVESTEKTTIYDFVQVTVVREAMTYVAGGENWTKVTDVSTLSSGDTIIIASESKGKVMGEFTGSNKYAAEGTATFESSTASSITGALEFTLESGSSSGTWNLKNGTKYLYGTSTKTTLCLSDTAADITISISSGDATIDFGSSCRILHNVNSTRFSNYTSATSTSMLLPQIYKKASETITVTDDLFNAVHDNFGAGKSYEWSESCSSFDNGMWLLAGEEITGLTDYEDYKLNIAVANESGNEIEQFLAKYDFIVAKFKNADYDFLGRFTTGGINDGSLRANVNPISLISNNSSQTVAIIIVISMIGVVSIGGYFFLRKRKEY